MVELRVSSACVSLDSQGKLKILIAEDNLTNQAVLRQMLGFLGLDAELANNGVEAVDAVGRAKSHPDQKFDVVFMDMKMPRMSGVEATQEIIKRFPDPKSRPKIIACTANAFAYNRKECADAGMDQYIAKPIIIPELEKVLRTCFPDWSPSIKAPLRPAQPQAAQTRVPAALISAPTPNEFPKPRKHHDTGAVKSPDRRHHKHHKRDTKKNKYAGASSPALVSDSSRKGSKRSKSKSKQSKHKRWTDSSSSDGFSSEEEVLVPPAVLAAGVASLAAAAAVAFLLTRR